MLLKGCFVVFFLVAIGSCASSNQDCYLFERGSHAFRECRANEGSKEYQYRMGVQEMLLGNHKTSREWLKKAAREVPQERWVRNPATFGLPEETFTMKTANPQDGNDGASFMLAQIYGEGIGISPDPRRAAQYLRLSRTVLVETEEFEDFFITNTYRITGRDLCGAVTKRFELSSFKVVKKSAVHH